MINVSNAFQTLIRVVIHTPDVMANSRLNYSIFSISFSSLLVLIRPNVYRLWVFIVEWTESKSNTLKETKARMKFQYLPCKLFELALFLKEGRN